MTLTSEFINHKRVGDLVIPAPGFWVKVYLESTFSQQLPGAVTTAASCNQKGLFYRPCSSKFQNFLALTRESPLKQFLWQERAREIVNFLLFLSLQVYNALFHAVHLTL